MKCGKLGKNIILMKETLWMMVLMNNVLFSDVNYLKIQKSSTNYYLSLVGEIFLKKIKINATFLQHKSFYICIEKLCRI